MLFYACVLRSGLLGLDNLPVRGLCLEKNDCPLSAASAVLPHVRFQERWTVDYTLLERSVVCLSLMHSWPLFCWQMYFSVSRNKVGARPWASAEMVTPWSSPALRQVGLEAGGGWSCHILLSAASWLPSFLLQPFAKKEVLCSFNNYPFSCTCRQELLEPHQVFREAPLTPFCWKCFSFPPFTSFHSSPYRHSHQLQSSSVFHSCPLWSDFAQTRLAQGEVPSPESTHCSPRSPAPWIHYYPNFHPVATAALLERLGY